MARSYFLHLAGIVLSLFVCLSCEPDDWSYEKNYYEISEWEWFVYYNESPTITGEQILIFGPYGNGTEWIYHNGIPVATYYFDWYWIDGYKSIVMEYGYNDYIYFTEIKIGNGWMSGFFDGTYTHFSGRY